jgi:BlaI family transcriptional regulator, penicillinase repressor
MPLPKLAKLELKVMEALWSRGALSIREILETLPPKGRPVYASIQTTVYRLEIKKAVRRVRRIGNADIFTAVVTRDAARGRLVDELLSLFGGKPQPVMAHLAQTGKLTLEDVKEVEDLIRQLAREDKKK